MVQKMSPGIKSLGDGDNASVDYYLLEFNWTSEGFLHDICCNLEINK